jgi:hypothetical protein
MNITPNPTTSAATPNDTTDVNNDARRNEAVITVSRVGSSCGSSAYVLPPLPDT